MVNEYQITSLALNGLAAGLEGKSEFIGTVSKRFVKGFMQKDINVGQTVDFVLPPRPNSWVEGRVIDPQATEYEKVSLTAIQKNTSRVISDADLELSAKEFFSDVVEPDINGGIREAEIESLLGVLNQGCMLDIDSIGQTPANSRVWSNIHAKSRMMLMPSQGNFGITDPLTMSALADNESKLFRPDELVDVAALDGRVSKFAGVGKFYDSVNLPTLTNGDGSCTGVLVKGANQTGNSLAVDTVAAGSKYLIGQKFWFSDATVGFALDPEKHFALPFKQTFTLTEECDVTANAATLVFAPAIIITGSLQNQLVSPPDDAAITFAGVPSGVYPVSMHYNKDAINFVGLKLPTFQERGGVTKSKDYMGLPLRTCYFTDYKEGQNYLRYDKMNGICNVRWQHVWIQLGELIES